METLPGHRVADCRVAPLGKHELVAEAGVSWQRPQREHKAHGDTRVRGAAGVRIWDCFRYGYREVRSAAGVRELPDNWGRGMISVDHKRGYVTDIRVG